MTNHPPTTTARELAKLSLTQMQDVLMARFIGREEATRMGFGPLILTRIATAISEMSRNVIQHSGTDGQISILDVSLSGRRGLKIIVHDKGHGIENLPSILQDNAQTSGSGIAGTRRLMDDFTIDSNPGSGTKVTMTKWLQEPQS
jgi:serine/threonine-protein kinase RsbT